MWRILLCAAAMAGAAVPAGAKCGTAQLDGQWSYTVVSTGTISAVAISDGKVLEGQGQIAEIKQARSCHVTLATPFGKLSGWSEVVPPASARRPRMFKVGSPQGSVLTFIRL